MNIEVKVVREKVTTYLIRDVHSLEEGERAALQGKGKRLDVQHEEPYVQVSYPVIIRDGQTVDAEGHDGKSVQDQPHHRS